MWFRRLDDFSYKDNIELSKQEIDEKISSLWQKVEALDEPREVRKLSSGKVIFPYDRGGKKLNLIIKRMWNRAEIEIKEKVKGKRKTKKKRNGRRDIRTILCRDITDFNQAIWSILNELILTNKVKSRPAVPKKGKLAYEYLLETKSLYDKPIELGFIPSEYNNAWFKDENEYFPKLKYEDQIKHQNLTREVKLIRSLRRKELTEAVEDRYGIPHGLLLAIMSHEYNGNIVLPNLKNRKTVYNKAKITQSDGGVGIHLQRQTGVRYWLNTYEWTHPYTLNEGRENINHGKDNIKLLETVGRNTAKLYPYDDRRHPIMSIDATARALIGESTNKNKLSSHPPKDRKIDDRIKAVKIYHTWSTTSLNTTKAKNYRKKVARERIVICKVNDDYKDPALTAAHKGKIELDGAGKDVFNTAEEAKKVQKVIDKAKLTIKGKKKQTIKDYRQHTTNELNASYGLKKYKKLGKFKY